MSEQTETPSRNDAADADGDLWIQVWGPATCRWLATPPQWTIELARRADLPLPEGLGLDDLVAMGDENGVLHRQTGPAPDGGIEVAFWVDEATRESWLTPAPADGLALARKVARAIAGVGVAAATPAVTRTWLCLPGLLSDAGPADEPDVDPVVEQVAEAVRAGKLAEAGRLVAAAAALATVVGGTYPDGVTRARRIVAQGHRQRHDAHHLQGFVADEAQVTALRELVESGAGDPWALHLVGPGGVGKTTLVRHLSSAGFAGSVHGAVRVARVDFDHLNRGYPDTRPSQLLVELADGLALFADTPAAQSALRTFYARARDHDLAPHDGDLAEEAFGGLLASLRRGSPPRVPLLVLDTCEELDAWHPPGIEVSAVEYTFGLLERLHRICPDLRIVLAGRRYLAFAGAGGWRVPEKAWRRDVVSDRERPYLACIELTGFDTATARALLTEPEPTTGHVPGPELVDVMLAGSPQVGLVWDEPVHGRHSPLLVRLHRDWWERHPEISPDDVRERGAVAYVADRIAARLDGDLRRPVLLTLAELGWIDAGILSTLAEPSGFDSAESVLRQLRSQEWISSSTVDDAGRTVLTVAPLLLPMLRSWLVRQVGHDDLRRRLVAELRARIDTSKIEVLSPEEVVSAVRLEALSPTEWERIEAQAARRGELARAGRLLERVLPAVRDDPRVDSRLLARLEATELCARMRSAPGTTWPAAWGRIARLVGDDPADRLLGDRAMTWISTRGSDALPVLLDALDTDNTTDDLFPTVVGALEFVLSGLDANERERAARGLDDVRGIAERLRHTRGHLDPALLSGALVALSRLLHPPASTACLDRAAGYASRAGESRPITWADRPTADGRDPQLWVALHRAAEAVHGDEVVPLDELRRWTRLAAIRAGVDADRLASCCLDLGARYRPPGRVDDALDALVARPPLVWSDPPHDPVHEEIRPLVVARAIARYREGRPIAARDALLKVLREAESVDEPVTVRGAEAALVWLATRMRWPDARPLLTDLGGGTPGLPELAALTGGTRYRENATDRVDPDILAEARLTMGPSDAIHHSLLRRAEAIAAFDPVTACQLATTVVTSQRNAAGDDEDLRSNVALVRDLYDEVSTLAGLPEWSSTAPYDDDDPWREWRRQWSVLDGSTHEPPRSDARRADAPSPLPTVLATVPYVFMLVALAVVVAVVLGGTVPAVIAISACGVLFGILMVLVLRDRIRRKPSPSLLRRCALEIDIDPRGRYAEATIRPVTRHARLLVGRDVLMRFRTTVDEPLLPPGVDYWPDDGLTIVLDPVSARDHTKDWETDLPGLTGNSPTWSYVFVRNVPGRPPPWSVGGTQMAVPSAWSRQVAKAYGPNVGTARGGRLLHMVGELVATSSGWAFDTLEENAVELHGRFWLTVVQRTPDDAAWDLRDEAGATLMRQAGVQLAEGGGWVLVLPPMPARAARQIWERLAGFSRRPKTPGRLDIVRLVGEIRRIVADERFHGREAARDVLLFGPWTSGPRTP